VVNVIAVSRTDTASALSSNPRLIKFTTICYHNRALPSLRKGGKGRINIYTSVWSPISSSSFLPLVLPQKICRTLKRKCEQGTHISGNIQFLFKENCQFIHWDTFLINDLNITWWTRKKLSVLCAFWECHSRYVQRVQKTFCDV